MAGCCSSEEGWGVLQGFPNFPGAHGGKQAHFPLLPQSIRDTLTLSTHLSPQAVCYFHTCTRRQAPLGIMKIVSCYQVFRSIWLTRPAGRFFHKVNWLCAPLTLADFEAINLCKRPLPENFNFAGDVLDQWSQKEKVDDDGLPREARCPFRFFARPAARDFRFDSFIPLGSLV